VKAVAKSKEQIRKEQNEAGKTGVKENKPGFGDKKIEGPNRPST
jgi:hypothetical protein